MEELKTPSRPHSVLVYSRPGAGDRLAELLRGRGCIVLTAERRDDARDAVTGVVPDAVLVGLEDGTPEDQASAFAAEVRQLTGKKPPLLVALGRDEPGAPLAPAGAAGFDFRLPEPTDPDDLLLLLAARRRALIAPPAKG